MLLLTPPAAREALRSELVEASPADDQDVMVPHPRLGAISCVLFVLTWVALGSFVLLVNLHTVDLFADPSPYRAEPGGLEIILGLGLFLVLFLAVLFLPFAGILTALVALCRRGHKPWAAIIGLCLHVLTIGGLFGLTRLL